MVQPIPLIDNALAWVIPVSILGGLLLVFVLAFLIWYIVTANRFRRYEVKIEEASSLIDVSLTRRYDLLSKSLEAVKGYAKHEKDVLLSVSALREPHRGSSMAERASYVTELDKAFTSLFAVAENYPTLKSSENFLALQNDIREAEDELQSSRRIYNSNVSALNQDIVVFPRSFVARRLHIVPRDFFKAEEKKTEDVEIKF